MLSSGRIDHAYPSLHWELVPLPECEAHNVQTDDSDKYKDKSGRDEKQLRHLRGKVSKFTPRGVKNEKLGARYCKHYSLSTNE